MKTKSMLETYRAKATTPLMVTFDKRKYDRVKWSNMITAFVPKNRNDRKIIVCDQTPFEFGGSEYRSMKWSILVDPRAT